MKKILIVTLVVFLFLLFTAIHEFTHYEIYKGYGCENIRFGANKGGLYTAAQCPNDDSDLPNAINEIVGYNIMPMLMLMLVVLILKKDESH